MNCCPSPGGKLSGYPMRWFPGLFPLNDFTVPGAATKQGRRQKPCNRTEHFPPRLPLRSDLRFPVAVLLRSAISEEANSKTLLYAEWRFPSTTHLLEARARI